MKLIPAAALALSAFPAVAAQVCALTDADKQANTALSFDEFDQRGTLPSTARKLGARGCFVQAVEASEHYLLHGPPRTDREQRIIVWHTAQALGLSGDERAAALLIAGTRDPGGINDRLDWSSYVTATWAFLSKNRAAFDAAAARLAASGRAPDRVNGAIVVAMGRCWTEPYRVAYDPGCGR